MQRTSKSYKKLFLIISVLIFTCFMLAFPAKAADSQDDTYQIDTQQLFEEQAQLTGTDEITDSVPTKTRQLMNELGIDSLDFNTLLSLAPGDIVKIIFSVVTDFFMTPFKSMLLLIGIIILCALLDAFRQSIDENGNTELFTTVCVLCACAAVMYPISECIKNAVAAVKSSADFMISFVPVFSTVLTASGRPVSAAAYNMLVFSAAQIVSQIASKTLMPLVFVYLAFSVTGAVVPSFNLGSVAKSVKSFINWTLGVTVTIFVSILGLQSFVASGADTVAMKTAKLILGSAIPIVGGAISEALSATQACVGLLKTSVGVYAVIAISLTLLPALAECILWLLSLKIAQTAADVMGISPLSKLFGAVQDSLSVLIAILSSFIVLSIVTTATMLVVGVGT